MKPSCGNRFFIIGIGYYVLCLQGVGLVFNNLPPKIGRRIFSRSSFYGVLKLFASLYFASFLISCSNPLGSNSSAQTNFLTSIGALNLTDKDDTSLGFGGGAFTGTAWDGMTSYLRLSQVGTPTNNSGMDSSWAPAWSNIVSYWQMENNWNDSVGSNNGAATNATFTTSSKIGSYAGSFNGSTTYITVPDNSTLHVSDITLMAWVKYDGGTGLEGIISKFSIPLGNDWLLRIYQNVINFTVAGDGTLNSQTNLAANTWYHVAATYNSSTHIRSVYINGVLDASDTDANPIPSDSNPVLIGCDYTSSSGRNLNGSLDEVVIWKTALTAAQIQSIYSRQSAKYAGTFQSRVMDGIAGGAMWASLSWVPTLPFFKELPATNETKANYPSLVKADGTSGDSALATGLVGIWHLDESSGTSGSGSVIDSSGQGNNGTPSSITFGVTGKMNTSANFTGNPSTINLPAYPAGTTVSVQAWVKGTVGGWYAVGGHPTINNDWFIGYYGGPGGTYATFRYDNGGEQSINGSLYKINDGNWHQIVGVSTSSKAYLYVDGKLESSNNTGGNWSGGAISIGSQAGAGNSFTGSIDEVAIWSRSLSASEVLELYRRGANRIEYQVRSCSASDCSDDAIGTNWKGPDGTNQTYYSELDNTTSYNTVNDVPSGSVQATLPTMTFSAFGALTIVPNRYFQYRAIMESDDSGTNCNYGSGPTWCSPELQNVSATIH
jgi:hypothetical protein